MKLKERKGIAKGFQKLREAFEMEDKDSVAAQETRSRSQKRRDDKTLRQAEAAARKAETRRLAEKEELENNSRKKEVVKLTAEELLIMREKELRERQKLAEENKRMERRVVPEIEYENMVLTVNPNRRDDDDDDDEGQKQECVVTGAERKRNKIERVPTSNMYI